MHKSKNPLLINSGFPPFDEILPEHVEPAVQVLIEQTKGKIENIESNFKPTWNGLMAPLELLSLQFEYSWNPVVHLLQVKNSEKLREAHEKMLKGVVDLELRIKQSIPIYKGLKQIRESVQWRLLNDAQKRVVELKIRDAELSGVGLTGKAKERFTEIERDLSQLGTDFSNNVLDATKAFELIITDKQDTLGWPERLKRFASQSYNQSRKSEDRIASFEEGPWRITLEAPSYIPFLKHSRQRDQREKIYRTLKTRASGGEFDNTTLISKILLLRKEKAKLLGFENYAQYSLASKMASEVEIENMFNELLIASKPHSVKEFEEIRELAIKEGQREPLEHWDIAFWAERLFEKKFQITEEQLRPYFPLDKVLEGLFSLVEELFEVTIKPAHGEAPVWHPDVQFFKIFDKQGPQIASFYLDPYSRPEEKKGGAWMNNCLNRRRVNGELRLPVVYLCLNSTPPVGSEPSLMSFDEVKTLFHEFGHGLQAMLTSVDHSEVAGINGVEWDAVEIASQFMENWCYHKPTLRCITRHVETGEHLPDELYCKLLEEKIYRAGSLMLKQLEYGLTDMQLHSVYNPNGNLTPFDVHHKIAKQTDIIPPLKDDRVLCSFTHLFSGGYAAGYYSYKWSEVLSADLFSAFEEIGLENQEKLSQLGKKLRDTLLALGGSKHPMEVFKAFHGREPSTEALLRQNGLAISP